MGLWNQAADSLVLAPVAPWWASTNPGERPEADNDYISTRWYEPYGDRRQELVFIGTGMETEKLEAMLGDCLLTDEEMSAGPSGLRRPASGLDMTP